MIDDVDIYTLASLMWSRAINLTDGIRTVRTASTQLDRISGDIRNKSNTRLLLSGRCVVTYNHMTAAYLSTVDGMRNTCADARYSFFLRVRAIYRLTDDYERIRDVSNKRVVRRLRNL